MKRFSIIAILIFTLIAPATAGRIVKSINHNWSFTPGWEVKRELTQTPQINIPHTWNLDALSGKANYNRMLGNYLREINIPKEWKETKSIYLRFKGVNHSAEVYINGKRVGNHKGGYTAFGFDITPYLNFDSHNTLWVRVSNAQDLDIMPLIGDFNIYGGIYRDVELIITPKVHISHTDHATSGVQITTTSITPSRANATISVEINGRSGMLAEATLVIKDGSGAVIDSTLRRIKFDIKGSNRVSWGATITNPRLWNGTIDPHLYSLDVVVKSVIDPNAKKPIITTDSITEYFGVRDFEVNEFNEFILNGKPYKLKGVTRHQDVAMLGSAIYGQNHRADIDLITEMGANAVRLTNYPQDPYFIELCDRAGIIVWSEIPFVGPGKYRDTGFNDSDEFKDNGAQQLTEMIAQLYNHPSIMFWGLFNELTQRGVDPSNYVKRLNTLAKNSDSRRLTVAASNQDGELNFITDLIGFNQYLGWSGGGMPRDIKAWSEAVRKDWPRLKVALSEYGAGGSIYQHSDSLVKPVVDSYWHPEQWQTYVHEQYLRVIESNPGFWGTFASSMFDWGSANQTSGDRAGVNDQGLVTFDRATRKDAFYLYKANWNRDDKFVYIASRRFYNRSKPIQTIQIFSACEEVTLTINNVTIGMVKNDGIGSFVFENCELKSGVNIIEALSTEGYYDRIEVMLNE